MTALMQILSAVVLMVVSVHGTGPDAAIPDYLIIDHPVVITDVFRVEHSSGPKKVATYEEAVQLCVDNGAVIAKSWRLRDSIHLRNGEPCRGCGWMMKSGRWFKNFRPECGIEEAAENKYYYKCEDDPADEGLEGYDVYCYGDTAPELPPDAVPINPAEGYKGYVYLLKKRRDDEIPTRSLAITNCRKRGAELATALQVTQAWYNGLDRCECGWMVNYQAQATHQTLQACGGRIGFEGCPYGTLAYSFCFQNDLDNPIGHAAIDFNTFSPGAFVSGIETGAIRINGGYVYPTPSIRGSGNTDSLTTAHLTCQEQGGQVATRAQMVEAQGAGMTWCRCGYIWEESNELLFGILVSQPHNAVFLASDTNAVTSCDGQTGITECADNSYKDLFCFKQCPDACPPDEAWNTPAGSTAIVGGIVFHMEHPDGRYSLNDEEAAADLCSSNRGSSLATPDQLHAAEENGMSRCACGYVQGGVLFPMHHVISSCAADVGVFSCPGDYADIPETGPGWDAYCFLGDALLSVRREIRHIADTRRT